VALVEEIDGLRKRVAMMETDGLRAAIAEARNGV
jgi:hypothetical protein